MPAACSLSSRLSTRNASITMSCVAEAVATRSAPTATSERRDRRIAGAEEHDRRDQQKLRQQQPAAAAAETPRQKRHVERVDQGRPQEFDGVGRADQREQADGAEIDAGLRHPDQQRRARQGQRQAGRKAEEQDDKDAPLEIDGERVRHGRARRCKRPPARALRPCAATRPLPACAHRRGNRHSIRPAPCVIAAELDCWMRSPRAFDLLDRDDRQPDVFGRLIEMGLQLADAIAQQADILHQTPDFIADLVGRLAHARVLLVLPHQLNRQHEQRRRDDDDLGAEGLLHQVVEIRRAVRHRPIPTART